MRIITGLRVSAAAAGAVGALALLPVGANAAFDPAFSAQCQGASSIAGRGASFQRQAHLAWGAEMLAPEAGAAQPTGFGYASTPNGGCAAFKVGAGNLITFEPKGSGDGRKAMGASTDMGDGTATKPRFAGIRDTNIQFGAADEPPKADELVRANEGPTTETADNATLLTVPVAQSAVAVVVKLPAGCTLPYDAHDISRVALEGVFAGKDAFDTWGEVFSGVTGTTTGGAACGSTLVQRVVRFDSSGTTFGFKNYLRDIDATANSGAPVDFPTSLKNEDWPTKGTRAPAPVVPRTGTGEGIKGAGALLDTLNGRADGGIGYADLATARNKDFDQNVDANGRPDDADATFWVDVERSDGIYQSPALGNTKGTPAQGSNCVNTTYIDAGKKRLPTVQESWYDVTANASTSDYALCVLTYELVWQDLAKAQVNRAAGTPAYTQAQARSVRDYLGYILKVGGGQAALAPNGYQALPASNSTDDTAVAGSVLDIAQAAQRSLSWNVTPPTGGNNGGDTGGGNGGDTGGGNTTPPTTPTPGPATPGPTPPGPAPAPAPAPVPNPAPVKAKVAVSKALGAKGRKITLTVSPSAAGKVTVSATTGSGSKKVTVGKATATAKKSGALKITLKPGAKGKIALKVGKTVKVTFKVIFTATNGTKTTVTKTIKVKIKR